MIIKSSHNPKIKLLQKLSLKKKQRDSQKLFVIEGKREISRAIKANLSPHSLYTSTNNQNKLKLNKNISENTPIYELEPRLFQKISYRQNSIGQIGIFHQPTTDIKQIKTNQNPFILIVESPEKPGNIGALLRTADAVAVDCIIITDPQADLFNPNVIRAACGTFFSRPIYLTTTSQTIKLLHDNNIKTIATTPEAKKTYYNIKYNQPIAVIAGREDIGLSQQWLKAADIKIKIPMLGIADSLNLSVSTGIVLYEAIKQRKTVI